MDLNPDSAFLYYAELFRMVAFETLACLDSSEEIGSPSLEDSLNFAVGAPASTEYDGLSSGWDHFSYHNMLEIYFGSERLTGYRARKKAINFKHTSGLSLAEIGLLDQVPEALIRYQEGRLARYAHRFGVYYLPDEGQYGKFKLSCRGTSSYQALVMADFEGLKDYLVAKGLPVLLIRLSARAPEGLSPLDSLLELKQIHNKFMSWFTTMMPVNFNPKPKEKNGKWVARKLIRPQYVWAFEPTGRGYSHIHFMVIGLDWFPKEKIDSWWKGHGLGTDKGVFVEALRKSVVNRKGETITSPEAALGYLMKYVGKDTGPKADKRWQGLLAITRKRSWGMSNNLRANVERWKAKKEPDNLTCIGLSNSKSSEAALEAHRPVLFIGILDKWEIEELIEVDSGPPPPDELLSDLKDIRLARKSLRERPGLTNHVGTVASFSQDLRDKISKASLDPLADHNFRQKERIKIFLEEGLSSAEISSRFPDLRIYLGVSS